MLDTKTVQNQPTAIVIFGGTGDLAETKLLPALLHLFINKALPNTFVIIGLSRKDFSDTQYQDFVRASIDKKNHGHPVAQVEEFCTHLRYVAGAFDVSESYTKIKQKLTEFDSSISQCTNKLFYLAVPPSYYETIFSQLHQSHLMALCDGESSWARLLVEKPFGKDVKTAAALEEQLCTLFKDEQIYRIDHYLAKDAIENIISLRFANSIIGDSWNKERIESIAITLLETKDVSNRGSFYDGLGTLRDVGQNHLLQTLALLLMDAVNVHDATAVRAGRAKALEELLCQQPDFVARAQYTGFTDSVGVAPDSQTETYFKISLISKSEKWRGVKISLEAGKALAQTVNEATITFRALDDCQCGSMSELHGHKNVLKIRFAPDQKISLQLWTKKPGFTLKLVPQELELMHADTIDASLPEAYERVLFDCIAGDQTRFVSSAEVAASWEFITPILELFPSLPLHQYTLGSSEPLSNQ